MTGVSMIARVAVLFGISAVPSAFERTAWPDLPKRGYIVGRVATVEDAKRGDAVFSTNGADGDAVQVVIPQYAIWTDEHGAKHPMILVQAKRAPDGMEMAGLRGLDGSETVATMPEVKLLGTKKPR